MTRTHSPIWGSLVCMAMLLLVPGAAAQTPFSTIEVTTGVSSNSNTTSVHQFWEAGSGISMRASTPFHKGYLSGGIRMIPYTPTTDVPAFDGSLFYGGWGLRWGYSERTALSVGGRVGILRMVFDDEVQSGIRIESETTVGVEAILQLYLTDRSSLSAGWAWERTYTRIRMNLQYLTVGYSFRFKTPEWLRTFLL